MSGPFEFEDSSPYVHGDRPRPPSTNHGGGGSAPARPFLIVSAVGGALGALFSSVSTSDFINHLDRQVHSIHCSLIPGAGASLGESGCKAVMMSPYSSWFRESMWGGIPISLMSLAVFAYLTVRAVDLALKPDVTRHDTLFLVAGAALPVVMSVVYGLISATAIGELCKLCMGVYLSSALLLGGAVVAHLKTEPEYGALPMGSFAGHFAEGTAYVVVLLVFYIIFAPVSPKSEKGCGTLVKKDDRGVLFELTKGSTPAIAVLDPLCPACKGFDERLQASSVVKELHIKGLLFPLDSACNWMVKESLHPGACAVSEAMLCKKEKAADILNWSFENQEELLTLGKESDNRVRAKILAAFPEVKGCLGSATVKNQVNKSLRFAVQNALPVLTPQLFVNGRRMCDEDTDLGLEYTIRQLIDAPPPGGKK